MSEKRFEAEILAQVQAGRISPTEAVRLFKDAKRGTPPPVAPEPRAAPAEERADAIAVIGMAGRFPGAENVRQFWDNLLVARDSISELPTDRWDASQLYEPAGEAADKSISKWGGFLSDIYGFDADFFGISPREAALMDPQQRLFLQEAWTALEDAGYAGHDIRGRRCCLFVGGVTGDYLTQLRTRGVPPDAYTLTGNTASILSARISYFLNLKGASVAVDTACSSALVAVHLACQSIRTGESEMAIAGGVMLFSTPELFVLCSRLGGMLSTSDGRCKVFDARADGIVLSEAVNVVVLKALSAAMRDGDHVYGVILGSGMNQDGKTPGITVPSGAAQTELESEIYSRLAVDPRTIGYVEAHGTGTKLGDPIELEALTAAFSKYTSDRQFCAIGSVKSNIGHAQIAAGTTGLVKALLMLRHGKIPASLHYQEKNPHIDFAQSPFYVATHTQDWPEPAGHRRRAAISSFGFSGTNVHMVLEEPPPVSPAGADVDGTGGPRIFVLSARSRAQLERYTRSIADFIHKAPAVSLAELTYTLQIGRDAMDERLAIVATSLEDLADKLDAFLRGAAHADVSTSTEQRSSSNGLAPAIVLPLDGRGARQLAAHFAHGGSVDWRRLYTEAPPRRVPLPTYPFAAARYLAEPPERPARRDEPAPGVHPLLDTNTSTFDEQRFSKRFSGHEFLLADHVVAGQKTLLGVSHLEMAIAAAALSGAAVPRKLRNVAWVRPLVVTDSPREVHVSLFQDSDDLAFEVSGQDAAGKSELYSQGKVVLGALPPPAALDLEACRARCTRQMSARDCYQIFSDNGLEYGPGLRTLQSLAYNSQESLSCLELPQTLQAELPRYVLHPSLMDGALQTLIGLIGDMSSGDNLYIPYSLAELEVFAPLPARVYVHATFAGNAEAAEFGEKRMNLIICGEDGAVLARLKELSYRPYGRATRPRERLYFRGVWRAAALPAVTSPSPVTRPVLLFACGERTEPRAKIRAELRAKLGSEVLLVTPGAGFRALGGGHYEVALDSEPAHRALLRALRETGQTPDAIVHFLGDGRASSLADSVRQSLALGFAAMFNLSRALIHEQLAARLVMVALDSGEPDPVFFGLGGFSRTLALEHPSLPCKVVGLDSVARFAEVVAAELESDEREVRYVESVRLAYRLEEILPSAVPKDSAPWPRGPAADRATRSGDRPVVLITGGAGGLGLIFAEHLHERLHCQVVLVGRSSPVGAQRQRIAALGRGTAPVLFLQADVTKRADVERVVAEVRTRYSRIDGVVHAAGAIRDSLIKNKSLADVDAVVLPKLLGCIYLDEATRRDPLQFFVLFSSISGLIGNIGQAEYSYANRFLDHFAGWRQRQGQLGQRSGTTLSIAWPLWRDGGMRISEQSERLLVNGLGIVPLDTQSGLEAFAAGLALHENNLCFVTGKRAKIEQTLGLAKQADKDRRTAAQAQGAAPDHELEPRLHETLRSAVAAILRKDADDLDADAHFGDYGFDSLTFIELANKLNARYELGLTPALFFERTTLRELARYLASEHGAKLQELDVKAAGAAGSSQAAAASEPAVRADVSVSPRARNKRHADSAAAAEKRQPVAIIGMSGIMPQCPDLDTFWRHLEAGHDLISEVPADRWDWRSYHGDPAKEPNKTRARWGGFMPEVDKFDCRFFNISPREAELMDPAQRLFLETVWATIEDAGYRTSALAGTRTAVFVGVGGTDYLDLILAQSPPLPIKAHTATGIAPSLLANRVSYLLDLRGPSEPINTACSGSLIAIHRAVQTLQSGECDLAIAGGVNVILTPLLTLSFSDAGMLSEDGRCKSFDAAANGYVRGEGVGALLLKPLDRAVADGDPIYAVIRGSAEGHGGHASSLTAPNPAAETALLVEAYERAGIDPATVGYIEAHGTGTPLGDPIEITALKQAFEALAARQGKALPGAPFCGIGSVKTNIGHLESAAGIAGVFKTVLAMKHGKLPAHLHFRKLNPYIKLEQSPFYVVEKTHDWRRMGSGDQELPRRAGVSSFGFGGANAHVILDEYREARSLDADTDDGPQLVVLSAANRDRLRAYAHKLRSFLQQQDDLPSLADLAYTLQTGREAHAERMALVARSLRELGDKLESYAQATGIIEGLYEGCVRRGRAGADQPDTQPLLDGLLASNDLAAIGRLWAAGAEVEWHKLRRTRAPRRVHLPAYPFARERYWLPQGSGSRGPRGGTPAVDSPTGGRSAAPPSAAPLRFEETWRPAALPQAGAHADQGVRSILFMLPSDADRQTLHDALREVAPQVTVFFASAERPTAGELEEIERTSGGIDAVFFLAAVASQALLKQPAELLHSLASLAILRSKPRALIVAGVYGDPIERCYLESLVAIETSLEWIFPDTRTSLVLVEKPSVPVLPVHSDTPYELRSIARRLWSELHQSEGRSVLYRAGQRMVRAIEPVDASVPSGRAAPRGLSGTWLITGGCGGLGAVLAQHLARTWAQGANGAAGRGGALNLILTGRSALSPEKTQQLTALTELGANALYLQADVCDPLTMELKLAEARARFGGITCVLHAAGVASYTSLLERDAARIGEVLEPKVDGVLSLDRLLADDPLTFVCYFSSSSAILGDFGACDYAVANRFLMLYARQRAALQERGERCGRTVAISWPLWREGGMRFGGGQRDTAAADERARVYLQSSGQRLLETDEALRLFDEIVVSGRPHELVLAGEPARIRQLVALPARPLPERRAPRPRAGSSEAGLPGVPDGRQPDLPVLSLEAGLHAELLELCSALLKIGSSDLDTRTNLTDFGFDSILLTELARKLGERYGVQISASVFFGHSTLAQVAEYLLSSHGDAVRSSYREPARAARSAPGSAPSLPASEEPARGASADSEPAGTRAVPSIEPIAVLGMSGRFPQARTIDEMWELLTKGRDAVAEIPQDRFDWKEYDGSSASRPRITTGACGCIPGLREFDAHFFEISPREAESMDPRQRHLLEQCWNALEHAGYGPRQLAENRIGVFVGVEEGDYHLLAPDGGITANHNAILAARLSYFLNLEGPALAINTACSSALVALHQACQSLWSRECDAVIVASANLVTGPSMLAKLSQAGMLSQEGKCRTFDEQASGMVPGEAVAAIVLKRLSAAERDGEPIRAVIRGIGINQDGRTNGITAPSRTAQARLLRSVYERFRIEPREIAHVVAHGTATKLGDPVELSALADCFAGAAGDAEGAEPRCALTSVKTNFGHTFAASGLVSLIALVESLRHDTVFPSLHCEQETSHFDWKTSPFYVNKTNRPWPKRAERERMGAVSSFGMSGTNAHVVLESYSARAPVAQGDAAPFQLLVLSAKTETALRARAQDLLAALTRQAGMRPDLSAVSATLLDGRHHFRYRLACVVSGVEDAMSVLQKFLRNEEAPSLLSRHVPRTFTGQQATARYGQELLDRSATLAGDLASYRDALLALADLFCQGYELRWRALFGPVRPPSADLPGYPFAREEHWVAAAASTESVAQPSKRAAVRGAQSSPQAPAAPTRPVQESALTGPAYAQVRARRPELQGFSPAQCVLWDLKALVSEILKVPRDQLAHDESFSEFGFDSISLASLAARISAHFQIELTPVVFFGRSTLAALTTYLLAEYEAPLLRCYEFDVEATAPNPLPTDAAASAKESAAGAAAVGEEGERSMPAAEGGSSSVPEPIAVIGMSGRFPQARDVKEMWRILAEGRDAVTEIPSERFDWREYYAGMIEGPECGPGKTNSKWLGCMPGAGEFDPLFFEISPRDAELMDPRQRLLLMEAYKALEDAGYGPRRIGASKIGMFVGVEDGEYKLYVNESITANHDGVLAARLAYFLNLHGPVMALNTACSSGLVAVHQASVSLRAGDCDTAIVAGINLMLTPEPYLRMSQAGMLSKDGRCYTFDARANGLVPGDAVVVFLLKRLSQAERDGDRIHAVLSGSGVNYDGKTSGITAPSGVMQAELLRSVYERHRIDPARIEYVIAHGTGTRLGDPVEVKALVDTFRQIMGDAYAEARATCALTSTKANFGHTFAASGLLSMAAVIQAFHHEAIPPSLHFDQPNEHLPLTQTPFFVNTALRPWKKPPGQVRLAALSAFGMSGTNAHAVLQSYSRKAAAPPQQPPYSLLVLSAKSEAALQQRMADLCLALQEPATRTAGLSSVSYTLLEGRHHFAHRCAIVVPDFEAALYALRLRRSEEKIPSVYHGRAPREHTGHEVIRSAVLHELRTLSASEGELAPSVAPARYQAALCALADLYCQGYEFSWEECFGDAPPPANRAAALSVLPGALLDRELARGGCGQRHAGLAAPCIDQDQSARLGRTQRSACGSERGVDGLPVF